MGNKREFRPDYGKLFPGVSLDEETAEFLKKADYRLDNERRRKKVRQRKDKDSGEVEILPPLEVSFNHLKANGKQFRVEDTDPESVAIKREQLETLARALKALDTDESALICALYFDGLAERDYASEIGVSQKTVNTRKHKVLDKIDFFGNYLSAFAFRQNVSMFQRAFCLQTLKIIISEEV